MLKTNCHKTLEEICEAAKAVLEHLFDNHHYCDESWCHAKRMQNQRLNSPDGEEGGEKDAFEQKEPPTHPYKYRNKITDKELYDQMLKAFEPFLKPERLMESLHGCSAQCNEAMNQSIAKYAPKNKSYGSTMSLSNRVAIAVGVFNYGHEKFWREVYSDIGMTMTSTLSLHLQMKDRKIEKRRENEKKPSVKLRRAQKQIERTNQLMEMERKDREKGAIYGTGIAITNVVPDEVRKKENELKKMLGNQN